MVTGHRSQGVETFGASLEKGGTYAILFAQRHFHAPIRALRILAPLVGSHKYHLFQVSLTCNVLTGIWLQVRANQRPCRNRAIFCILVAGCRILRLFAALRIHAPRYGMKKQPYSGKV